MSFWSELRRRNVFKVAAAYAVVAWLLIQIASILLPAFGAPAWVMPVFSIIVLLGFPLALVFAWAFELTPEGVKPTSAVDPTVSITDQTGQKLNYVVIGLLVLAVVVMALDNYVLVEAPDTPRVTSADEPAAPAAATVPKSTGSLAVPEKSIAVLPFADMSPGKDQEYFSDGISEELLNQLAKIKGLQVAGRTSSFYFKDRNEDLRMIGEKLGVAHILEGSVRKAGDRVRITAQLIKVADGYHLWSETYDRQLDDIFAIQEETARAVARALSITLGIGDLAAGSDGGTRNFAAYDAFLAGRSLINQTGRENYARAIEQLERAVTLDPEFALAWITLADIYQDAGNVWISERADELYRKRDAARDRALAIAPEAHRSIVLASSFSGNRVETERLLLKAIELAPSNAGTNSGYGWYLMETGRVRDAIPFLVRATLIDPLSTATATALGMAHELNRDFDAALQEFRRGKGLVGDSAMLASTIAVVAMETGDRALMETGFIEYTATDLIPIDNRTLNTDMLALLDTPDAARRALHRLHGDPVYDVPFVRSGIAVWASYFDDHELALTIYREGRVPTLPVVWRPVHREMRRMPGFKEVVTRLGLVDYWRTTGNWGDFCRPLGADDFECE